MNKRLLNILTFVLLLVGLGSCVSAVPVGASAGVYVGPRPFYRPYFYNRPPVVVVPPPVVVRPRPYVYRVPGPRFYGGRRGWRRW